MRRDGGTADNSGVVTPELIKAELACLGAAVNDHQLSAFGQYLDLLLEANQRFNLTAIRDEGQAWRRHVIDSLTVVAFLERLGVGLRVIDVGTGGGLPGIPLAIARPAIHVTLLEATRKKANFCRQCAEHLSLPNVDVINDRAETVGRAGGHRERYDAALCRAIGPMRELLEYTMPLVRIGGQVIAMKGPKAADELAGAANALDVLGQGAVQVFAAYPNETGPDTVIAIITKRVKTPGAYPRLPGVPRRSPL